MKNKRARARLALVKKGSNTKEHSQRAPAIATRFDTARFPDGAVLTVTVNALFCPLERFRELGVTLQLAPAGAPEHVSVTMPSNPGDSESES
jgi:hypothetical protein